MERIKKLCAYMTPCGSRVTCNPPVLDTDEDFILLAMQQDVGVSRMGMLERATKVVNEVAEDLEGCTVSYTGAYSGSYLFKMFVGDREGGFGLNKKEIENLRPEVFKHAIKEQVIGAYRHIKKPDLFQVELAKHPFWMLVACMMARHTPWERAKEQFTELWMQCGTPMRVHEREEAWLSELLRPLGLQNIRAHQLKAMAQAFVEKPPRTRHDVLQLPGCGQYAADSWAIFIEKDYSVQPEDKMLRQWLGLA